MPAINLDALLAQKKEANGGVAPDRVAFTFEGETFTFLDPSLADDKTLKAFENIGSNPVDIAKTYMGLTSTSGSATRAAVPPISS